MSPLNKRKSVFSKRTAIDITKRRNLTMHNTGVASFIRENTIKDSLLLKNPVVILQRLPNILPCGSQKMSKMIVDNSWKILESSCTRISSNNRNNDRRNIRSPSNLPLKFSTPRTKQQRPKGNSTSNRNSLSCSSENSCDTNQNSIVTRSGARKKNETYELIEPETPNLQRELHKRQNKKDGRTESNGEEMKKTLKVNSKRFFSDMNRTRIPVLQALRYKKKLAKKSNDRTVAITENKNIKDLKNSTPKKVPNFAEIHEKLFAKSESIVDAQKRLRERHATLSTSKINNLPMFNFNQKNNSLSCDTNKNQFRFKMRIKDATNCILRKQPTVNLTRSKRQQQNREFLKGVRTNRRFELQMKSRNMNL